ncbi:DUF3152 domain-containing protein [Streptacidiphilus sp. ASG 303]|uniref:DUF3152 domain-containing protein n=1 Tax=Streptacidiphilus sp. ASG 303 TaxID=2896847 RepID=UPI001E477F11|nr:DUF3152 domain-containing protein [Streptacidiphilus sp. ASG 303]MCD0485838.1 DUF3152 domain-containing protein [Streptacidiphilus sp. ASG 303]
MTTALVAVVCGAGHLLTVPGTPAPARTVAVPPTAEATAAPTKHPPTHTTAAPKPSPPPSPKASYPVNGPGTYTWAKGTSERIGTRGRLIRYAVRLEDGTNLDVDDVAKEIKGILADPRGWTRHGVASFQQVDRPPYEMLVTLASPGTTDRLCARWGLDTGGEVNCGVAPNLIVNLRRWIELSPQYAGRPHAYHTLIINHEAGHDLGYGHRTCPGPGLPAPAMMQQIKGLRGCRPNPYVYDSDGTFIDGPKVP